MKIWLLAKGGQLVIDRLQANSEDENEAIEQEGDADEAGEGSERQMRAPKRSYARMATNTSKKGRKINKVHKK